jgi:hypothetical protein
MTLQNALFHQDKAFELILELLFLIQTKLCYETLGIMFFNHSTNGLVILSVTMLCHLIPTRCILYVIDIIPYYSWGSTSTQACRKGY